MSNRNEEVRGFLNVVIALLKDALSFCLDALRNTHKEGHIFVFIGAVVTVVGYLLASFLGNIFLLITVWIIYFFRDPHRIVPQQKGVLVAPADGTITAIVENESLPEELKFTTEEKFTRVSIFLNVFNVHVNRIPAKADVIEARYIPGKFLNANLDKSSKENERNILLLKTEDGEYLAVTQIAGLIARRIVSYAKTNDAFETGERYGIIRFGSRADVFIPESYEVLVLMGQTMIGGETIIARK
jgi:phosphatidylserine decarboxylase